MAIHPLDEGQGSGLEQIKARLQAQTALNSRIEVGEVVADGDINVSRTLTPTNNG